jgi:hypothetical protein
MWRIVRCSARPRLPFASCAFHLFVDRLTPLAAGIRDGDHPADFDLPARQQLQRDR